MPELPEVETSRRFLAPVLDGRRLVRVEVRRSRMARRNERPEDVVERLSGRRVEALDRRGKFIVAGVEDDFTMVLHLGMSGRFQIAAPGEEERPHTNVVLATDVGTEVRMIDPRTFGFIAVFTPEEYAASSLSGLGADAYHALPSPGALGAVLAGRSAPIKALLLDQRIISGLGNIYADEVLFRARIHPRRAGGSLTSAEVAALHAAIRHVLDEGIEHGGTSLDDLSYLLPDGRAGEYVDRLAAYGRDGKPCGVCGRMIERVVIAQRSTHFCPRCQSEEGR